MDGESDEVGDDVAVNMEITGTYEDVVDRLRISESRNQEVGNVAADLARILETIDDIDGGTKSVIVENLPGEMSAAYDSDAVVSALQVLELYDLVTLDGNTWKRGP